LLFSNLNLVPFSLLHRNIYHLHVSSYLPCRAQEDTKKMYNHIMVVSRERLSMLKMPV
jgi:hypothetical protein